MKLFVNQIRENKNDLAQPKDSKNSTWQQKVDYFFYQKKR